MRLAEKNGPAIWPQWSFEAYASKPVWLASQQARHGGPLSINRIPVPYKRGAIRRCVDQVGLLAHQHRGPGSLLGRALQLIHPRQFDRQHVLVQEEQRTKRLVMSRCRNGSFVSKV